ncbi:MAG TPA: hypothetical protein VLA74_09820 [Nitrososphaeraceae archaeon]|nr:hypothetical protein [Nitrososphaeraceae archaeon]
MLYSNSGIQIITLYECEEQLQMESISSRALAMILRLPNPSIGQFRKPFEGFFPRSVQL